MRPSHGFVRAQHQAARRVDSAVATPNPVPLQLASYQQQQPQQQQLLQHQQYLLYLKSQSVPPQHAVAHNQGNLQQQEDAPPSTEASVCSKPVTLVHPSIKSGENENSFSLDIPQASVEEDSHTLTGRSVKVNAALQSGRRLYERVASLTTSSLSSTVEGRVRSGTKRVSSDGDDDSEVGRHKSNVFGGGGGGSMAKSDDLVRAGQGSLVEKEVERQRAKEGSFFNTSPHSFLKASKRRRTTATP